MTDTPTNPAASAESAKLFASFIARRASGEEVDFSALRTQAPELAAELAALESAWNEVGEVLHQLGIGGSLSRPASGDRASAKEASGEADVVEEVLDRLSHRSVGATRYLVKGEVGSGGMGAVLRVWDSDLRRNLAMKIVLAQDVPGTKSDPRVLTRFIEEAQVTGQLDHPGIVPVHELGLNADGNVYFTMRLVAGRDLEKIFGLVEREEEGWSRTRAVGVLLKVCEAMAYAHSKGVVHRDLKPANVMVGGFGEVYVMDWGLAHVCAEKPVAPLPLRDETALVFTDLQEAKASSQSPQVTMDGDVVGTPAYMPPEQARGETRAVGPLSDVYSAGAVLYRLIAGRMPYERPGEKQSALDVWKLVREGPPEALDALAPGAPAELTAICEKAMAREPAMRYGGMLELADDLRAYLEGRVVHAYEGGALAEFRKWVGRNKALALTAAVAIFLVTVGSTTASLVLANKNEQLGLANDTSRLNEVRANKAAAAATRNAVLAQERADEVLRLSDVKQVDILRTDAEALWPPAPANEQALADWLVAAHAVMDRFTLHSSTLLTLRTRATGRDPWTFTSTEDQWQHDTLAGLVTELRELTATDTGLLADVERRFEFASTVEARSRTSPEARKLWREAIAEHDGEFALTAQLGLLPLGRDPASGLLEFAHLQSGEVAKRDENDELLVTEATGVILVLVPGGTFWMGAQAVDEADYNFSERANEKEDPPHEVTLEPFFISKYEVTQAQWLRTFGTNPSAHGPDAVFGDVTHSLLHPVEQVSWHACSSMARRLGLVLPTEAQWEYACRAGSEEQWFTGGDRESLIGAANLADQSVTRAGEDWPTLADWPEFDDGYPLHAPVGSFEPNRFGLHDMAGNVWEWVRDGFGFYTSPVSGPDAERDPTHPQFRINRGGSYRHEATHARSSHRNNSVPETLHSAVGVRLARPLVP